MYYIKTFHLTRILNSFRGGGGIILQMKLHFHYIIIICFIHFNIILLFFNRWTIWTFCVFSIERFIVIYIRIYSYFKIFVFFCLVFCNSANSSFFHLTKDLCEISFINFFFCSFSIYFKLNFLKFALYFFIVLIKNFRFPILRPIY